MADPHVRIAELTSENARLNAENTELAEQVASLKLSASEHVLVEDSWFKREDLPKILGNFMRSSAEHAREAKALSERITAKNAELDHCIQGSLDAGVEFAAKIEAARAELDRVIREAAADKALIAEFASLQDRIPDLDNGDWGLGWDSGYNAALSDVRAMAAPEMPRPPAEETGIPTPRISPQGNEQPANDSTEGDTE